jgi:hypothetical protein
MTPAQRADLDQLIAAANAAVAELLAAVDAIATEQRRALDQMRERDPRFWPGQKRLMDLNSLAARVLVDWPWAVDPRSGVPSPKPRRRRWLSWGERLAE